jgi:hypothetical protein
VPQPPGSGTLAEQLADLKRQIAELSRSSPSFPACRVRPTQDLGLAAGDNQAATNWTPQEDPQDWFTRASPSYITIPVTGFYLLNYHCCAAGPGPAERLACKIQRNSTSVADSIASDIASYSGGATEGAICNAFRPRIRLDAGDRLYWSTYSSVPATLKQSQLGVLTEITVQFISSR